MKRFVAGTVLCLGALGSAACGSDPPPAPPSTRGTPSRTDQATAAAQEPAANGPGVHAGDGGVDDGGGRAPPLPIVDTDLAESDRARDPFRSFAQEFVPVGPSVPLDEHAIKLRDIGLDQLTLVAVILGTGNPYAMVIDPSGTGTIIRRGEYVGRPETVAGSEGQLAHQLPWRVARISGSRVSRDRDNNLTEVPGEVVFEREDRLNPNAVRAEHVVTLAPGSQATRPTDAPPSGPAIPMLPGFAPGASPFLPTGPNSANRGPGGTTVVQSYTQVIPPQPAQQAPPTTVVIQTGPHGEVTTTGGTGANGAPGANGNPNGPGGSNAAGGFNGTPPTGTAPGATNGPPPVQINSGPTFPSPGLPLHGLP